MKKSRGRLFAIPFGYGRSLLVPNSFQARFTPQHWASSPRNSSDVFFPFSLPPQTPPLRLPLRLRVPHPLRPPLYLRPRLLSPQRLTLLRLRRLPLLPCPNCRGACRLEVANFRSEQTRENRQPRWRSLLSLFDPKVPELATAYAYGVPLCGFSRLDYA